MRPPFDRGRSSYKKLRNMLPHAGRFHEHKIKTMDASLASSHRLGRGSNVRGSLSCVDNRESHFASIQLGVYLRGLVRVCSFGNESICELSSVEECFCFREA